MSPAYPAAEDAASFRCGAVMTVSSRKTKSTRGREAPKTKRTSFIGVLLSGDCRAGTKAGQILDLYFL
jgi:hypothetical protein